MTERPGIMPQNVKEAAEMFALGSISLSQLAEQVETSVKPIYEIGLLQWALEYAESYYEEYEKKVGEDYEVYLMTGGEFHSQKEFEEWLDGAEQDSIEQQCYEEELEEYLSGLEDYQRWYEEQKYEQYTLTPEEEEKFAKQLTGELPIKNGNKLSLVNELFLSEFHLSREFSDKYPEAYKIYQAYYDML